MKSFIMKAQTIWNTLASRERRLIVGGVTILVMASLWLVADGLWQERQALQDKRKRLEGELAWLGEQAKILGRLPPLCRSVEWLSAAPRERMTRMAEDHAVAVDHIEERGEGWRLTLSSDHGNGLLQLTHALACQGFALSALDISVASDTSESESGTYHARLELHHEND